MGKLGRGKNTLVQGLAAGPTRRRAEQSCAWGLTFAVRTSRCANSPGGPWRVLFKSGSE